MAARDPATALFNIADNNILIFSKEVPPSHSMHFLSFTSPYSLSDLLLRFPFSVPSVTLTPYGRLITSISPRKQE